VKIAYLTLDEVHEDLARRMSLARGDVLSSLAARIPTPDEEFDAVVYDLDYLPPDLCRTVLAELATGPVRYQRAVHSYNLRKKQAERFRQRGVIVCRTLSAVFTRLTRAYANRQFEHPNLASVPPVKLL
jgi:hypothetical protein